MIKTRKFVTFSAALALCSLALFSSAAIGQTGPKYAVNINTNDGTNSIKGTSGFVLFAYNPGSVSGYLPAKADTTAFTIHNGSFNPTDSAIQSNGAVTGDLGSTLSILNSDPGGFNGWLQPLKFDNSLSFDVAFSGLAFDPAQTSTFGSLYTVSLYDSRGNSLLTSEPNGDIVQIDVAPNAVVTTSTFPVSSDIGSPTEASISSVDLSVVPEPSTNAAMLAGMILLVGMVGAGRLAKRKA